MLSKKSYETLKEFPERVYIRDARPIHRELEEMGYLRRHSDGGADLQLNFYCITEKGRAAVDEYRREQRKEWRENASVWLSLIAIAVSIFTLLSDRLSGILFQ